MKKVDATTAAFRTDHIVMPEDHMEELYSSSNPLVRFAHTKRLLRIAALIPKTSCRILDAGCGEGHLLALLRKKNPSCILYGADVTFIALKKAKRRCPSASYSLQDLGRLSFKDQFFDVITCTEVIEHIPHYSTVLEEFARVLRPGGILIITYPNEPLWTMSRILLGRKPWRVPDHVNSFSHKTMKTAARGFATKRAESLPFRIIPFRLSLGGILVLRKNI